MPFVSTPSLKIFTSLSLLDLQTNSLKTFNTFTFRGVFAADLFNLIMNMIAHVTLLYLYVQNVYLIWDIIFILFFLFFRTFLY